MIAPLLLVLSALPLALSEVNQAPYERKNAPCTTKSIRKSWNNLTVTEKQDYLDADLCLMSLPPKAGIEGAKSRWDELQYAHAAQARYIHGVGAFLPFHRYFVTVHDHLLRAECNYTGPLPYWDEPVDVGNISASSLFNGEPSFGGNGTGPNNCIADGPFANVTLRISENLTTTEYCISRFLNDRALAGGARPIIDNCLQQANYTGIWKCLEGSPHGAGHGGVSGTMMNVQLSPGDPIFYLHHGYLDRVWWDWQTRNLSARLFEVAGNNTPSGNGGFGFPPDAGFNFTGPPPFGGGNFTGPPFFGGGGGGGGGGGFNFTTPPVNRAIEDYFYDGGNATTLNHTLWSAGIVENVTIADVMDAEGGFVCGDYQLK
ncbi:Di-copper centre-containing protein [Nemania diffusa]|nr:Di-copper centre-containing protein [Nemania diffusa]